MRHFKGYVCGIWMLVTVSLMAQSPHGEDLKVRCDACHTADSWNVKQDSISFDHDSTRFALQGTHQVVDCRQCHTSLEFTQAESKCASCHLDIHQNTVGDDCSRCHNSNTWFVSNIAELHRQAAFPLLGAHGSADCSSCHISNTDLRFEPMGTQCITCHQGDYDATTNPEHNKAGFSTECLECHRNDAYTWTGAGINHDFFPLTEGHAIDQCATCHTGPDYSKTSPECLACHEANYMATTNPKHPAANISTDCASCHTTKPGWKPAEFREHDQLSFPIYSGTHQGTWDNCTDCHTDPNNYAIFTCITCHANPETDDAHGGITGYEYSNTACLACHPTGEKDDAFNHDNSGFPLTGEHITTECLQCHTNGFAGTPIECVACHNVDFEQTTNPNHTTLGFSNDCKACHSTQADWNPATFANHNDYYVLSGAHAIIANDCAACHQGDYNSTPATCVGCHQQDFDQTTNPSHSASHFSTDCATCHNEDAWTPATFDHDGAYFPIYSGKHEGVWTDCQECHTTPGNYGEFTCITCHANPETDQQHNGMPGYSYNSTACLGCHPDGSADGVFDHNTTNFPLTGAHTTTECVKCHANGFAGTPTACEACHTTDYNQSLNPKHGALGFSMDCATCHTTAPGWSPASFDNHNDYYALNGAHGEIANECVMCHNGDYNNTPNRCAGCHEAEYNGANNPPHLALQFSTDCTTCHTEEAWVPASFNHDEQYFPIYSGKHEGVWSQCTDCHTTLGVWTIVTCTNCHVNPETDEQHNGISGYVYNTTACLACHPTGDGDGAFDHNNSNFPLTGAHQTVDCNQCHTSGYEGTPTNCDACHMQDYNQSANPRHPDLNLSTACATCHTTEPDWSPASFDIHNQYYVLNGAHAMIANQCASCHNGDYNNTPTTCVGCHQQDYNQTDNPPHAALNFPTTCTTCHSESTWTPAAFEDHDAQYFPIYSGAHEGVWDACSECHTTPGNYAVFSCVACHNNSECDPQHSGVGGYVYDNTACLACHPTGDSGGAFDHNTSNFPLTGAHQTVDCIQCHAAGYEGTPTNCDACHMQDYNQSANPDHQTLNLPTECATCHTTEPDWNPASFDIHNQYYVLAGAHAAIADQCVTCHNGDYNNTPNTCAGCHLDQYNQTDNPPHVALNFPTECATCHSETAWVPAEYTEHDNQYFPIYSGAHQGVWDECSECHTNPSNYAVFTCTTCHANPETNQQHATVGGYFYESTACLACHPTGDSDGAFDHNTSGFPLTGAHQAVECISCHASGYEGTPTNCDACHMPDYNQSVNPNHQTLNIPTECATCHTTEPDWNPASFGIHNQYYVLAGAHAAIADQCVTCHNGDYNNTPNTCAGCHLDQYNQTDDPPHVALNFPTECATCHSETAWVPAEYTEHDAQYFPIYSGAHQGVWDECSECHTNPNNYAVFTCTSCHTNPETDQQHSGVGGYVYDNTACLACHPTGDSQGAFDHNNSNFPLTGAHQAVDCIDCHSAGYQGTPTNCDACHMPDYNQSINPNHVNLNIPTECATCHTTEPDWNPASFDIHNQYYVLAGAHAAIADQCVTCHNGDYNNTPNTCAGCHLDEYNQTDNPPHAALNFPTECATCHTESSWVPAEYTEHDDQYFPIYSGAHQGVWSECSECHTNPSNYGVYTCTTCHTNPETNDQHSGVSGYIYESTACLACHPTGDSQGAFDHNNSDFPLTGAHQNVDCIDCHAGGYQGTPTNCDACHMPDYNQSINPNHVNLNIPTECATCHTTDPDWNPASFDIHNQYYVLAGAHAAIADQCVTCHNGDYNNTPNTCAGCHMDEYNQTDNPSHTALNFPTECATCHNENTWVPAEYTEHDDQYFPIYSGAHQGVWDECSECHTNPSNYAVYTCTTCHTNPETNQQHSGVNGYIYENTACLACHPTGDAQGAFDHQNSDFPLTGAHQTVDCIECHAGGYQGTPTECDACHMTDYNQSVNPNHQSLDFPTACATCHTTEPDWSPATFDIHNQYYVLEGAHVAIADQCVTCHNGDYNNTPNTCSGCHQDDYNQTDNPSHTALNFPTDCAQCHSQDEWVPATWDHDDQYFPIYSGAHQGVWSECSECHTNANNYSVYTCTTCHTNPETNQQHSGVNGYIYESAACLACHPTGDSQGAFDHNNSDFPLTGAHQTVDCIECHSGGYQGTPTNCDACHMMDYNQSANPDHQNLNLPTDCIMCHTTEPDWNPASFDIHNQYYVLEGAHAAIADECVTCHNGNYNNTPNTCSGCHMDDYNQTDNPSHTALNFPTQCATCHTQSAWAPAEYTEHDDQFFPIYSGAHQGEWDQCNDCHTNSNNYSVFTCVTCHTNPQTNQQHNGVNGYVYESAACLACHPTGDAQGAFDHNNSDFPLTGAHQTVDCIDCHAGGYQGTPTNCDACHMPDYNQSSNPDHQTLNLPIQCNTCHTTAPDWNPATFDIHNQYYVLAGAHAAIADECVTCHNGNYNNTPNTCVGCHLNDYNQTNDPDHQAANFPTDCAACHSQNAWVPATWDHDDQYFPIYSGSHEGAWDQCSDCHTNPNDYSVFTCLTCHQPGPTNNDHDEVPGYQYNSAACLACHPDGND